MSEEEIIRIAALNDVMISTDDGDEIDRCIEQLSKYSQHQIRYAMQNRKRAKHNVDRKNKRITASGCGACAHFNENNGKCLLTNRKAKRMGCNQHQTLKELRRLTK